ncbi:MAG: hypothetical protein U9Q67_04620 [Patescibacteria group bacterium]|nr:hypothetical protein [Patescibacteria group bacterium]
MIETPNKTPSQLVDGKLDAVLKGSRPFEFRDPEKSRQLLEFILLSYALESIKSSEVMGIQNEKYRSELIQRFDKLHNENAAAVYMPAIVENTNGFQNLPALAVIVGGTTNRMVLALAIDGFGGLHPILAQSATYSSGHVHGFPAVSNIIDRFSCCTTSSDIPETITSALNELSELWND